MATQQQVLDELLRGLEPEIAAAFREAVAELRRGADLQRVIQALSANDINAAIEALNLDPAAFSALLEAIRAGYLAGGDSGAALLTGLRPPGRPTLTIRFDVRNRRAEAWLQEHSSSLVTQIIDDQRVAIRQALRAGMERGENPRSTALDVVGRVNKATGRREGGVIGLTANQTDYAETARQELASADPADLRHYLTRARRDKRYDPSVKKAIREERELDPVIAAKAVGSYKNRLLALRGEMLARTEAMASLHASRQEAYLQAVDRGDIDAGAVRRTWRSAGDGRVRHTHRGLNGVTVGLLEPFRSPSGAWLMFPGDPKAPAAEIIGCRCTVAYRVDFLANLS
jgi:hypothetical protein